MLLRRFAAELRFAIAATVVVAVQVGADAVSADELRFDGICDASAAIALSGDTFVVAEDEHDVLRYYKLGSPVAIDGPLELSGYLGNIENGKRKEADIEGAAKIGDVIYWIASHGRNSDGEIREFRYRFFATTIGTGDSPIVELGTQVPYKKLLSDLLGDEALKSLKLEEASKLAPKQSGLNIEGLAATSSGGLLLGFRSPLSAGKAIVIGLTNPSELVAKDGDAQASLSPYAPLDLGGRGIRSIELVGTDYLIVAGPASEDDNAETPQPAFALYRWSGIDGEAPLKLSSIDFGSLHPESIFEIGEQGDVMVLSDDGKRQIDGEDCKDVSKDKRMFRAVVISGASLAP